MATILIIFLRINLIKWPNYCILDIKTFKSKLGRNAKLGICRRRLSVRLCVCVCVCVYVTLINHWCTGWSDDGRQTIPERAWLRHVTPFKFWWPIHISGMAEARALKFCRNGDYVKSFEKDDKSPLKGAWFCSSDPFLYAQIEQNHAPFRGDLSSLWQDLIWSLFVHNLRALASAGTSYDQNVHKIWSLYVYSLQIYERRRKVQKLGWFGG